MTEYNTYAELKLIFLTHEEGGRVQPPCLNDQKYRPHLRILPNQEMLGVEFVDGPDGPSSVGIPVCATVRLVYGPKVAYSDLHVGAKVEVLEGAHVVGHGHVIRR